MKLILAAILAATTASAQTFAPVSTTFTFAGNMYVSAPGLRILNCPLSGTGQVTAKGKVKIRSVVACAGVTATKIPWSWEATGVNLGKGHVAFSVNGTDCSTSDQIYVNGGVFGFTDSGRTPCTINGDALTIPAIRVVS